ncbi:membrane-spanning 4-domains subfamily A member 7 isoform X1 [Acomys russatus]|uniref:membrane-spanning 4-domains subfamily A member 7 isoform X1 n=1 Tax=Acomys russatus TaxID=60746 RepID=UPI0021E32665|nr:membrane-spanning 4-domains subfamily A member 7 isoform X1 [Acomys russatus]
MLNTKRIGWGCLPKDTIIHKREKDGHTFQKGDDLKIGEPNEATVLGTIQILCALMIASLGVILVSASYSSNFRPEASSTLMSGYSFVGSLCALSSLASNGASSVVAGIGLFLLSHSLVALGTVLPHCNSEKKFLSLLTYLESHLWRNDDYSCHLAHVSAIVSSFRPNILSCKMPPSSLWTVSAFSAISGHVGLTVWGRQEENQ